MDIYDEAVEYLTRKIEERRSSPDPSCESFIEHVWNTAISDPEKGAILFQTVHMKRNSNSACDENGRYCGCLTQIKAGSVAQTQELTDLIRLDPKIPNSGCKITVDLLPHFAEWNRKIDQMLGRKAPKTISG